MRLRLFVLVLLVAAGPAFAQHQHGSMAPVPTGAPPLYDNLGSWTHPVGTKVVKAQRYFDQGMRLYYGFNHDEAIRAFREAARLDPSLAMAWWGIAASAGPNINLPMDPDHATIANEAIAKAKALAPKAGAADRAYVAALATRYSADPKANRAALDTAYAQAMVRRQR